MGKERQGDSVTKDLEVLEILEAPKTKKVEVYDVTPSYDGDNLYKIHTRTFYIYNDTDLAVRDIEFMSKDFLLGEYQIDVDTMPKRFKS